MDRHLSHLLELRLKVRGDAEGSTLVDRGLALVARARTADHATMCELEQEVDAIRNQLALHFGAAVNSAIR